MWIDCHCHTRLSNDNWLEPVDLVRRAKQLGLDGLVVTEHHSVEASEPVELIGREEGLLVLRGIEISSDRGHLLAFGLRDDGWNVWGRNNYLPLQDLIDRINELAITAADFLGLPALGGSDCHKLEAVGRCATEFARPVVDMASFIAAVREGACHAAYYPGYPASTRDAR